MKKYDVRFTSEMISELKDMIGKKLIQIRCNPFEFSTAIYGIVGIVTEDKAYSFTNMVEVADYYGDLEDVAMFRVEKTDVDKIQSKIPGKVMIDIPVNGAIKGIRIIEEHQEVFQNGLQTYDVWLIRGIIFDMEDGLEISLEKAVWFSEMIYVERGYDLLSKYVSTSEFEDDWSPGYIGKASRTIIELKADL